MLQAIDYIGAENLEDIAIHAHSPLSGIYVYVRMDGEIFSIVKNRDRVEFNSKYNGMDYYSEIVSMQKPVKSKLIFSNNYLTFFCRNVEKLTDQDVDDYFSKLEIPEEYAFFPATVKKHIRNLDKDRMDVVKFFLLERPEKYRELGLRDWREKAIGKTYVPAKYKDMGFPVSCTYNYKKPYQMSKMYLVEKDTGLQIKLFHDILKGLKYRGYDMLVVGKDIFIPLKRGEFPDREIIGAEIIAFTLKNGQAVIAHMDSIARFTPWLE